MTWVSSSDTEKDSSDLNSCHLYCIWFSFCSLFHRWMSGGLFNWIIVGGLLYGIPIETSNHSRTLCQDKAAWCLVSYCYHQWLFTALLVCLQIPKRLPGRYNFPLWTSQDASTLGSWMKCWKPKACFSLLYELSSPEHFLQQPCAITLGSKRWKRTSGEPLLQDGHCSSCPTAVDPENAHHPRSQGFIFQFTDDMENAH